MRRTVASETAKYAAVSRASKTAVGCPWRSKATVESTVESGVFI
jgi:hypothetical protein